MPGRKELDYIYQQAHVYTIEDSKSGKFYIGSFGDCTLGERLKWHKTGAKVALSPMHRYFNEVGWDRAVIRELESYKNILVRDLLLEENEWLVGCDYLTDENCLNKNIAIRPKDDKELSEHIKVTNARYYETHKEQCNKKTIECMRRKRAADLEGTRTKDREKYHDNREDILKRLKDKREGDEGNALRERQRKAEKKRREETTTECEVCGGTYDCKTKKGHELTKQHQEALPEDQRNPEAERKRLAKQEKAAERIQKQEKVTEEPTECNICGGHYIKCTKRRHMKSLQHKACLAAAAEEAEFIPKDQDPSPEILKE